MQERTRSDGLQAKFDCCIMSLFSGVEMAACKSVVGAEQLVFQ